MFGGFFSRFGGIFAPTRSATEVKKNSFETNLGSESAKNINSQAREPKDAPSKSRSQSENEFNVVVQDVLDHSLLIKPMRRYGRICDCPKDPNFSMFCRKARNWYENTNSGSQTIAEETGNKYSKMKTMYKNLATMQPDEDSLAQIERDLGRTFPRHHYFMKSIGGRGHEKLRRVLIAFSNYERQVNYVQGMNFIVA